MRRLIIGILLISWSSWCGAKTIFPANHESVVMENKYAEEAAIPRYTTQAQISRDSTLGILVPIPITVAPRLPVERRYVRRSVASFLLELDARFNQATGHFLIVDSAVRSEETQKQIARRNKSAAPATGERASSHERGTTFDLAKKSYSNGQVTRIRKAQYRLLLMWLSYYQGTGRVHVIEERACLHIMVRED